MPNRRYVQECREWVEVIQAGYCKDCSSFRRIRETCSRDKRAVNPADECHVIDKNFLKTRHAGSICPSILTNTLYAEERERHPLDD